MALATVPLLAQHGSWWPKARVIAGVLVASAIGVAAAVFVATHLAFMLRVTSNSMAPYVRAGDYGVAIYTHRIERGDVIVFRFPFGAAGAWRSSTPWSCRVSACLGTAPVRRRARSFRRCTTVRPARSSRPVPCSWWATMSARPIDSRSFGAVPAEEIVGKVVLALPMTRWLAGGKESGLSGTHSRRRRIHSAGNPVNQSRPRWLSGGYPNQTSSVRCPTDASFSGLYPLTLISESKFSADRPRPDMRPQLLQLRRHPRFDQLEDVYGSAPVSSHKEPI